MSFSRDVKKELSLQISNARHCKIAELAAILSFGGRICCNGPERVLRLQTESLEVARKYFTLIRKTFNINIEISIKTNVQLKKNRIYTLVIRQYDSILRILQATKLYKGQILEGDIGTVDSLVVQNLAVKEHSFEGHFCLLINE